MTPTRILARPHRTLFPRLLAALVLVTSLLVAAASAPAPVAAQDATPPAAAAADAATVPTETAPPVDASTQTSAENPPPAVETPTPTPTEIATGAPTDVSTEAPAVDPTEAATHVPSEVPSDVPTGETTAAAPTDAPTETASEIPTDAAAATDTPASETPTPTVGSTEAPPQPSAAPSPTPPGDVAASDVNHSFTVETRDADGALVTDATTGGCFTLTLSEVQIDSVAAAEVVPTFAGACDGDDGALDGRVHFANLGSPPFFGLNENRPPDGYLQGVSYYFGSFDSDPNPFPVTHRSAATAALTVSSRDQTTNALISDQSGGAGISIHGPSGDRTAYDGDDGATDGVVHFSGLIVGLYRVAQYKAPNGYPAAALTEITLTATGPNEVTFLNQTGTTTVTLRIVDGAGNLLTDATVGACISVPAAATFTTQCDGYDGALDGVLTAPVTPGTYSFGEYRGPDGWSLVAPVRATIVVGGNIVDLVHQAATEVTIRTVDQNGAPLFDDGSLGACYFFQSGHSSNLCDADDGVRDGSVTFAMQPGPLDEGEGPFGADLIFGDHLREKKQFTATVVAGQPTEITVVNPEAGALEIGVTDESGHSLSGACFTVLPVATSCDGFDGAADGVVHLSGLQLTGTLHQESAPAGHLAAADQEIGPLASGGSTLITVVNARVGETLTIHVTDGAGAAVPGAAFSLQAAGAAAVARSDADDGAADGTVTFPSVAPGAYHLAQTAAPTGFSPVAGQDLTIVASGPNSLDLVNPPVNTAGATLKVTLLDASGDPIGNACYGLSSSNRETSISFCDEDGDGTATSTDSTEQLPVSFPYTLYVYAGRDRPHFPSQQITLVPGVNEITLRETGDFAALDVHSTDSDGHRLYGSCFELREDAGGGVPGALVDTTCFTEGMGRTLFSFKGGNFLIVETKATYLYDLADPVSVALVLGTRTEVTIRHTLSATAAELAVQFVDQDGRPFHETNTVSFCFTAVFDSNDNGQLDQSDGVEWKSCSSGAPFVFPVLPGKSLVHGYSYGRYTTDDAVHPVTLAAGERATVTLQFLRTNAVTVQVLACSLETDGDARVEVDILDRAPVDVSAASAERSSECLPPDQVDVALTGATFPRVIQAARGRGEVRDAEVGPNHWVVYGGQQGTASGDVTFEAGHTYLFFVQFYVAKDKLPPPRPTPSATPEPGGKGNAEIFVFACDGGATNFKVFPDSGIFSPPNPEPDSIVDQNGNVSVLSSTGSGCSAAGGTFTLDGGDPFHVSNGTVLYDLASGKHTLKDACSGATSDLPVVADRTVKVLVLEPGTCPAAATPTPGPTPAKTATATTGKVTSLPVTGVGPLPADRIPSRNDAGPVAVIALVLLLALAKVRRPRRAR